MGGEPTKQVEALMATESPRHGGMRNAIQLGCHLTPLDANERRPTASEVGDDSTAL